jgi:hypothetical protein
MRWNLQAISAKVYASYESSILRNQFYKANFMQLTPFVSLHEEKQSWRKCVRTGSRDEPMDLRERTIEEIA